jgi:hypothetical protein
MQKFNCHLVRLICFLEQVASWWCIVMRGNPTVWRKRFRFFVDPRFLLAGRFSSIIYIVAAWAQPISIFIPNFVDSCRRPPRSPSATSSTYRSWLHPHPWPLRGGSGKPITWTKEPRTGHLPEKQKNPTVPLYKIKAVFHCLSMLERWTMMDALNTQKASEWGVFDFGLPMAAYGCLWLRLPCWICVHLRSMACSIWGLLQQLGDPGFMEPWSHGPWMRIESTKTIDTAWYSMIMNDIWMIYEWYR